MLSIDAVERAQSGHPGVCLGAADIAFVLWSRFLRFDPTNPDWPDRDRFILSPGHASMLVYSLLHLAGYGLGLDEIRQFRQRGSRTAGHPELGLAPGIEVTTGPLGQGFAHGVGMALAGRMMAARFNRNGHSPVNFRVLGLCGDGDLMEGLSYEAASLAGDLQLGNLTWIFDSNGITIEGGTDLTFSEDVRGRFEAQGWHVAETDGYDHEAISAAIAAGIGQTDRPSLIIAHTEIGHGAPNVHGSNSTHGAPLGPDEVRATKEAANWPTDPPFLVPDDVKEWFHALAEAGREARMGWEASFADYCAAFPDLAEKWNASFDRAAVPPDLFNGIMAAVKPFEGKATRVLSGKAIAAAADLVPNLVGGSADLGPSNKTQIPGAAFIHPAVGADGFSGANLHFGIREHAMTAVVNGITLQGGFRSYGGTFLVFADYMKPALRLASLMEIPSIFVFTHDSFAVGEDGPTHQPVEHLWMLRSIPGMKVFRPADAVEVAAAWSFALRNTGGPVSLVFTRQGVPPFERPADAGESAVLRGGYVVKDPDGAAPDVVLAATGSEVSAAFRAATLLEGDGTRVRVVSLPCLELFFQQPDEYRESVVPRGARVVTVEAGSTVGWHRLAGVDGLAIGLDHFGASAPASVLTEEFGFTPAAIADRIRGWL
ncbi:MAG: transketolase [Deltaproteobacteria bacterium]|nr:transketolase [Deltaproteobacteria bacterium]